MQRKQCKNCKYFEAGVDVCCNGDSYFRADFVDPSFTCMHWTSAEGQMEGQDNA